MPKGYLSPIWLLALIIPWLPELKVVPTLARSPVGRRRALLVLTGFLLFNLRLPPLPQSGETVQLEGHWLAGRPAAARVFVGGLRDQPELRLKGIGERAPAAGSRFRGRAIILPGRSGSEREARLLTWWSDATESAATAAARVRKPTPRLHRSARITRFWPASTRPLARALLLGERSTLEYRTRCRFRDAGLAHLLALSGLHVGLFLLLCRRALTLTGFGPARAEWILLPVLPWLPWLFGGGPSINRAAFMACHILLQRRLGGRPVAGEALAFAACLEMIRTPAALFTPGFQLSYLATIVLIVTMSRMGNPPQELRRRLTQIAGRGMYASLVCTLSTLPVAVTVFRRLPLAGPLWNLLAGPVCALALCLGWPTLPFALTETTAWLTRPAAGAFDLLRELAGLGGGRFPLVLIDIRPPTWTWGLWCLGFRWLLRKRGAWGVVALPLMLFPVIWDRLPPFP
ncbi:MAG: ComEC/Rec2 family competence protein [bacterium]|nr:ComEC/Rec2 family competence protein [bacterium]